MQKYRNLGISALVILFFVVFVWSAQSKTDLDTASQIDILHDEVTRTRNDYVTSVLQHQSGGWQMLYGSYGQQGIPRSVWENFHKKLVAYQKDMQSHKQSLVALQSFSGGDKDTRKLLASARDRIDRTLNSINWVLPDTERRIDVARH